MENLKSFENFDDYHQRNMHTVSVDRDVDSKQSRPSQQQIAAAFTVVTMNRDLKYWLEYEETSSENPFLEDYSVTNIQDVAEMVDTIEGAYFEESDEMFDIQIKAEMEALGRICIFATGKVSTQILTSYAMQNL